MPSTLEIIDATGRVLARIIDRPEQGTAELRNHAGKLLAQYRAKDNLTYDYTGRVLGRGNLLTNLI